MADIGSLNKAADELYVSQPSLSAALREVENELGITVFRRSGRGMELTSDGVEFVTSARGILIQYDRLMEQYTKEGGIKKKFGISTQHYSFAVKCFVEVVKQFNTTEYEFAIRETKTREIIDDVHALRSEIGILFLSNFNRKTIEKQLQANDLEFVKLKECRAYVYLAKTHPLASRESISFADLEPYPCLSFEQGGEASYYYAEEILGEKNYKRVIKANDRATMLNLMIGLDGYTLCSGLICEELNGGAYKAVPFVDPEFDSEGVMEIGYIKKRNLIMGKIAELYIKELKAYLDEHSP